MINELGQFVGLLPVWEAQQTKSMNVFTVFLIFYLSVHFGSSTAGGRACAIGATLNDVTFLQKLWNNPRSPALTQTKALSCVFTEATKKDSS